MKNGMNRIDQKDAHSLVALGWTPAQISRQLKIKQHVIEAWLPNLTPEGWEAYRSKVQQDRAAMATAAKQLSQEDAVALAKAQILAEEKLRAEIRAELAAEAEAKDAEKEAASPQKEVNATADKDSAVAESEPTPDASGEVASGRRRRSRKDLVS